MNTDLSLMLKNWLRWMRFQRSVSWAQHGLTLGLILALAIGSIQLIEARLLRGEFLTLVFALALTLPILCGITAYLWPIPLNKAARHFDRVFNLQERLSTALELNKDQRTASRLLQQQFQDTLAAAQTVRPERDMPVRLKAFEGLLALIFVALVGLIWVRGDPWFQAAQQTRAVQQAVNLQEQKIEQIIQQIQSNPSLSEQQKQALTEPLQQAQQGLQANPSLENSVSILTSTNEKLQALSDAQAPQLSQALQQAGTQLAGQPGSPLESMGQQLANGNPISAAAQLKNLDLSKLNAADAQQLANQLKNMAQTLGSTDPQLASDLNSAAQALSQGDTAAAQAAIQQAAKDLAQNGQQIILSQTAGQAAQQMQAGAGQILAAGGSPQNAPGTQGQAGTNQSGQANGAGQPGSSQNPSQGSGTSGSGKGEGQGSQTAGNEAGSAPIPQNNGAGDGGQSNYEQIYAPSLLGGGQGPTVQLPSSGQGQDGTVTGQGPTSPSDSNQSLVPYTQVYSQYQQTNTQAIENGDVPFDFIQVIRSYFNSLTP